MLDLTWQIDMDAETFDNLDSQHRLGSTADQPKGRLLSLSLFGSPSAPRYAAVWENGGRPREQRIVQGDKLFVQDMYFLLRGLGFTAEIIAATGDGSTTHFALVMRRRYAGEGAGHVDWDLPIAALLPANLGAGKTPRVIQSRRKENYRLSWAVTYRAGGDPPLPPMIAAVWAPQQVPVRSPWATKDVAVARWTPWNVEPNDRPRTFQKKFDAHVAGGSRLQLVVPYCPSPGCGEGPSQIVNNVASNWLTDPRYLSVWYGDMIGPWWCRVGMDKGECEALRYDPPPELDGLAPVRLLATGSAKDPRYAVIFASRTDALPKYAKVVKPYTPGPLISYGDKLDDKTIDFMARNGIRRGQVAGTVKERLVAARAYTVAEAGYEQGRPTGHRDVFRIASVSKTLTALLVMRRIQDGAFISLDDEVGSLMGWGGAWSGVTLRKLLLHVDSLRIGDPSEQAYLDRYNLAAALGPPFGGNALPPTTLPITDTIVYEPLLEDAAIGTDGLWEYSNPGFELLGRVLTRSSGPPLDAQVLGIWGSTTPAAIGRLRPGHVGLADQAPGEVFYHGGIPAVVIDRVGGSGEWVPASYGVRNVAARVASGGWACAAIDLARVMAYLEHDAGGLLTHESVEKWLWGKEWTAGVTTTTSGAKLRPGLGWDGYVNGAATSFGPVALPTLLIKNGGVTGYTSLLARHYDGRSLAVVFNGNRIESLADEGVLGPGDAWGLIGYMPPAPATFDLFRSANVDPLWAAQ